MPELIRDMPFEAYRRRQGLNKSSAVHLLKSAAHYRRQLDLEAAGERKVTPAMVLGIATHYKLSNEGHCVAVAPQVNKRTKAGREAWDDFADRHSHCIIVTPDEDDQSTAIVDAIACHPIAGAIYAQGEAEVSAFFEAQDIECKGRMDVLDVKGAVYQALPKRWQDEVPHWRDGVIADWKVTNTLEPHLLQRTAAGFHADLQAVWYREAVKAATGLQLPFVFVYVEADPPHGIAVMEAGETMLDRGWTDFYTVLNRYKEAMTSGVWSNYPPAIETLELPAYAQMRIDDAIAW